MDPPYHPSDATRQANAERPSAYEQTPYYQSQNGPPPPAPGHYHHQQYVQQPLAYPPSDITPQYLPPLHNVIHTTSTQDARYQQAQSRPQAQPNLHTYAHTVQPVQQEPPPGSSSVQVDEADATSLPEAHTNWTYKLEVKQQPARARMCGSGERDRRPLSPPPCIRLAIFDQDGVEINYDNIDPSLFIILVDLWNVDGTQEMNLTSAVSNSTNDSGITTPSTTYMPLGNEPASLGYQNPAQASMRDVTYGGHQSNGYPAAEYAMQPNPAHAHPSRNSNGGYTHSPMLPSQQYYLPSDYRPVPPGLSTLPTQGYDTPNGYGEGSGPPVAQIPGKASSRYNLVGNRAVTAFILRDTEQRPGVWFILHDLSIRHEGFYRLKFSVVHMLRPGARHKQEANITKERTPILVSCFSQAFQVWSAKKFPGVKKSTALSKVFSDQGIKIPIRKGGEGSDDENQAE
ncbi:velvet factor-domain-containing protein [Emericellopsis atlantica]|uniref:Velvet factor-domain-containing protein n=1 Tax=Emericellopsis atlantica TaxID=2614577 RepID=A0A9P7ZKB8_9HYPO|nr:velvet factor-domain-containing protein [Emericellopsis atlantica]KAG9253526.1 velvet factor-domain-containing protein [Emericellopsis atlantica]